MQRKKWTPKAEVGEDDLKMRDKKRWQIALRRYVVHRQPSALYAPFFGIDMDGFRQWIELHFDEGLNWDNFGLAWQFDHVLPAVHFDFNSDADMKLCWNFINIRIDPTGEGRNRAAAFDLNTTISYFEDIYSATHWHICPAMIGKLKQMAEGAKRPLNDLTAFINGRSGYLTHLASMDAADFQRINQGVPLDEILAERILLARFG